MKSHKSQKLLLTIILVLLGSCGAIEDNRISEISEKAEAKNLDDSSAGSFITDPTTDLRYADCWVRCTDAPVSQCKFTIAYNIGHRGDCATAGRMWCANRRFTYTWTGCSREGTEHPNCRCDPRGHCEPR